MEITMESMQMQAADQIWEIAKIIGPFMLAIMAVGLIVNVSQVGFHISWKAAEPQWSRINPLNGFGRFFSVRALVELGKSLAKLIVVGAVLTYALLGAAQEIPWLFFMSPAQIAPEIGRIVSDVFLSAALALIVIGGLDYLYQRYDFEQSLKMTKDEVKEEAKQQEGDPRVKGKIREIMIKTARRRMMKSIPEADVVITNPIHLAVAIKYDRSKSSAPIVVAKGARKIAEKIKEIAAENGVPIVENKPLAQALYKTVELGMEIPVELYKAVAEVLAYVYRIKKKFFSVA
jgi:flagellar biosynthetic protein FlhB